MADWISSRRARECPVWAPDVMSVQFRPSPLFQMHSILFVIKDGALIAANTGAAFTREGVISVCHMDLSAKREHIGGAKISHNDYVRAGNELIEEIARSHTAQYEQFPRTLLEHAESEKRVDNDYAGRFVWELLQNADDAGVQEDNKQLIGHMGLGFKSVLEITEEPEIYSGDFHFHFSRQKTREKLAEITKGWRNFSPPVCRIPHANAPNPFCRRLMKAGYKTVIRIPLKKGKEETVKKQLGVLANDDNYLLFCHRLQSVKIRTETDRMDFAVKRAVTETTPDGAERIHITRDINGEQTSDAWNVWRMEKAAASGKRISAAICLPLAGGKIVSCEKEQPVHVFFPTEERIENLRALVHASCDVQSDRKRLRDEFAGDDEVCGELKTLTSKAILGIPPATALTAFGRVKPGDKMTGKLARAIADALNNTPFLPVVGGEQKAVIGDVIATDDHLPRIIQAARLAKMDVGASIKNRRHWLVPGIAGKDNRFGIPYYGIERYIEDAAEGGCLSQLSDKQMEDLYCALSARWSTPSGINEPLKWRWERLPIFRTNDGRHLPAKPKSGNRAYMPPDDFAETEFPTVKKCFLTGKSGEFVKAMLAKPDLLAEIRDIIAPRYKDGAKFPNDARHISDMRKILEAVGKGAKPPINDNRIVKAISGFGERVARAFDGLYFRDADLSCFFANNPDIFFVDEEFYDSMLDISDNWREKFRKLGVQTRIKFMNDHSYYSPGHGHHQRGTGGFNPGFDIEGLTFALEQIQQNRKFSEELRRSALVWNLAATYPLKFYGEIQTKTRQDRPWPPGEWRLSQAGKHLQNYSWIYDRNGNLLSPAQVKNMRFADLNECYAADEKVEPLLASIIGMEFDDTESLKKKVRELEAKIVKLEGEKPPAPAPAPPFGKIETGVLTKRKKQPPPPRGPKSPMRPKEPGNGDEVLSGDKGRDAEKAFEDFLKREYEPDGYSVQWTNNIRDNNKGYDFELSRGNERILIELKSFSAGKCPLSVELTKSQMEWAKANEQWCRFWLYILYGCPGNPQAVKIENTAARCRGASRYYVSTEEE